MKHFYSYLIYAWNFRSPLSVSAFVQKIIIDQFSYYEYDLDIKVYSFKYYSYQRERKVKYEKVYLER